MNAPTDHTAASSFTGWIIRTAASLAVLVPMAGCEIIGVMGRTFEETGSSIIPAQYEGLADANFAVLISADRNIQGVHPELVTRMTQLITQRLAVVENTDANGFVPAASIIEFQLTNPSWNSWTYDEVAQEFGVDRLVVVDIYEFRLNAPGNQYVWEGVAMARVGVVESDSALPDDFTYTEDVRVAYPDGRGFTKSDFTRRHVYGFLEKRLVDRVSWLFYEHEEPNAIEY